MSMSMKSLLLTLPEDLENIVYKYNHQLKMKDVLDELISKVYYCNECNMAKASIHNHICQDCDEHMCDYCYVEELTEESYITCGVTCYECKELAYVLAERDDDETSSQIAYAEEELWRDVYGIPSLTF